MTPPPGFMAYLGVGFGLALDLDPILFLLFHLPFPFALSLLTIIMGAGVPSECWSQQFSTLPTIR